MSVSSRKISVWLLVLLLPVLGYLGWYNYRHFTGADEAPGPDTPNPKWRFATEEHWLVDETARDIAEMLSFARDGRIDALEVTVTPTKGKHESYDLQAKRPESSAETSFQSKDYIWAPGEYAPWAEKIAAAWKLTPKTPATKDNAILEALTSPTPEVLLRESKRLTEALTKTPLDAGLHEQAALVTGAFALREAAGEFYDIRREICRIAAHLAIARALDPQGSNPVRKFAEATLQTLAEREAPALAQLTELEHDTTPGAAAWVRALRLRNTTDWRQEAPKPTLFEELETFFARVRDVGPAFAFQWLEKRQPAAVHDWRRLILEGDFGVELGHEFAKTSLPQEINSLQTDWASFHGGKLPDSEIAKALNEPAARCVSPGQGAAASLTVLGWDMWSAQHQRYVCQSIRATITFLRDQWGVPEYRDAQQFMRKNFDSLLLYPLLERDLTENRGELPAISQRVAKLLDNHPEAVPPAAWGQLLSAEENAPALTVAGPQAWLHPPLPFGTTYDICTRQQCIALPGGNDTAWWSATLRLGPATYEVVRANLWARYAKNPPLEVAETAYAPLKDYCLWALRRLAELEKGHSPKYLETMQRMCELDPDRYFELGNYYHGANQPEQAAAAYEKGVELCPDRVLMANKCGWLVNYLDDHGQTEKALAIATEAAEVYSYGGLETMAKLKEKHGQFKEAEDFYKKIAERYDKAGPLGAFYLRNRDKDPEFQKAADAAVQKIFPDGMSKVALAELQNAPADGTVLTSISPSATAAGLHIGDVIVALDGYRVGSEKQYLFVRGLTTDPKLQLIVWNAQGFREIAASVPERSFNIRLGDYHGAKK